MDLNSVRLLKDFCIVRTSNKSLEDTFNIETETLREDIILSKEIPELSMNILGGKLRLKHLKYRPKGTAMELWDKSKRLAKQRYNQNYIKEPIATPVFFYVGDLNDRPFPYHKPDDKETRKLVELLKLDATKVNGQFAFTGSCHIIHTPNKINYWHVEIQLRDITNNPIKSQGTWLKNATKAYIDVIMANAKIHIPKFRKIKRSVYQIAA